MNRPKASAVVMWTTIFVTAAVVLALLVSFARLSDDNTALHEAVDTSQAQSQSLATQANALEQQVRDLGERPVTNVRPIDPFPGPAGEPGAVGLMGPMGPAGVSITGARGPRGLRGIRGASVVGESGIQGEPGSDGASVTGPQGEPGIDGKDGAQGEPGKDGRPGRDGRGVESVSCEGPPQTFTFHYSDGSSETVTCEPAPPPAEEPLP